jgi:EmrB/QacA subfamily drug resistance transporter
LAHTTGSAGASAPVKPSTLLLITSGATFLAFLDATVVNVAFPALAEDFPETSVSTLSWVVSSYAVLFAALLTAAGRLADVLGRRKLFVISVLVFTVASVACAIAPSMEFLIAARAVQGAAAAGMIPASLGLVLYGTPPERRTIAIGIWSAAGSMAAAAGPVIGGLLVEYSSWRAVFFINLPIGLAVVAGALKKLANDRPTARRLPDPIGSVIITVGIALMVVGLTKGTDWGWAELSTIGSIVGGVLLTLLGVLRSRTQEVPAVDTSLWKSHAFASANVVSALAGAAMFGWLLTGPLFVTSVWGYSILEGALAVTPGAVTSAIASIIVGKRATPRAQRIAIVVGMLLFAVNGWVMYAVIDETPAFLTVWLWVGLVGGAALGMTMTGLSTVSALAVPPMKFATGVGLNTTARQLGGALGIAAVAAVLAERGIGEVLGYRESFLLTGVLALVAAVAGLLLLRRSAAGAPPAAAQPTATQKVSADNA